MGHEYGYAHPHESDFTAHAPNDYWLGPLYSAEQAGWMQQVWAEGALEGAKDGLQYGHDVTVNPQHSGGGEGPSGLGAAAHVGGHAVAESAVHTAEAVEFVETLEAGVTVETATYTVASAAVGLAAGALAGFLILVLTETEDPEVARTEPHELGKLLASKCTEKGCSEIYLPYCTATTGHSGGGSDGVFLAGLWHGQLFYEWNSAESEAYQHLVNERHWHETGVLHYVASAPDDVDWMVLVPQHHA